jgi:hypothetical protein
VSAVNPAAELVEKKFGRDVTTTPKRAPYPGEDRLHRRGASLMHSTGHMIAVGTPADQVADLLAAVAVANGRIAVAADRIARSRVAVSLATVDRLARPADGLRPGVEARGQLAQLHPELLLAGTSLWLARRRRATTLPIRTATAAVRAAAGWGGASA